MEDLTNIKATKTASDIAKDIIAKYGIKDAITFFHIAMAYALANHASEIDFKRLDAEYDTSGGLQYNVGSFKKPSLFLPVLNSFYPDCTTPFRYIQVLITYGTYKIKERLDAGEDFSDIVAVL